MGNITLETIYKKVADLQRDVVLIPCGRDRRVVH
jgi:hypothetical protein